MASTELTTLEQNYLEILEARIKSGLKTFWQVGEALAEIRDKRLYRQEYSTFKEYCDKQWGFSDSRARRLISSAEVIEDVKQVSAPTNDKSVPMGTLLNERQARELVDVPREARAKTLQAAIQTAPNGKPTAAHIKQVVQTAQTTPKAKTVAAIVKAHLAKPAPKPSSSNEALQHHEQRIAEDLRAIQSQKLYRKVAESFEDYLDGLVERVKETAEAQN